MEFGKALTPYVNPLTQSDGSNGPESTEDDNNGGVCGNGAAAPADPAPNAAAAVRASIVGRPSALKCLNLDSNPVTNGGQDFEGVREFAEMLGLNSTLKVRLHHQKIGVGSGGGEAEGARG